MRLLTLVAVMLASACEAVTTTSTLFLDAPEVNYVRLLEANSGQMFVRAADADGAMRLYRITRDGRRGEVPIKADDFPVGLLGNQVIALRASAPAGLVQLPSGAFTTGPQQFQIVLLNGSSPKSTSLFQTPNAVYDMRALAALDGSAVYASARQDDHATEEDSRSVVWRIDPKGAVQWQFATPGRAYLVAIPGGVVVVSELDNGQTQLQALSDSGLVRWSTRYANDYNERVAFMPPQRLAILYPGPASQARLLYLDVRDGKQVSTATAPPGNALRANAAGLLVYGNVRGEPHVSLLAPNGAQLWTRRLPVAGIGSNLLDATVTRSGELLIVAQSAKRDTDVPGPRSVAILRTSAINPIATPGCLDVDPEELQSLEANLSSSHALQIMLRRDAAPGLCSAPGDPQYLAFLRELRAGLGPERWSRGRRSITVEVHADESHFRLATYAQDRRSDSCFPSSPAFAYIRYATNITAGRELGMHLRSEVLPHLKTLGRLQQEFQQYTGRSVSVQRRSDAQPDIALFPQLEAAAANLLREARKYSREQWATVQQQQGVGRPWSIAISEDSFGAQSQMRPLSELPNTLRQFISAEALR